VPAAPVGAGFFRTQKRSWELRLGITVETTENRGRWGVKRRKLRYARSALGPCRNGRVRAWAVTNGRPRFGGTAGRGPFGSRSWDNADARFGLWSRRSLRDGRPGESAADNRRQQRAYLLLRSSLQTGLSHPPPNAPNMLHIAPNR
jgi:hypothetical protein